MKKILVLIAFYTFLFGAEFNMKTAYSLLLNTKDGYGEITDSPDIIVGSSGVIMHKFSNDEESIIARAEVTQKKDGFAKIRFERFDLLKQPAFPIPKLLPENGDEVILNFLYDRSLIVVPNKEIYKEVEKTFNNITFIHPDIVASYLHYEYKPNPSRNDFRKMCARNAAGLIFIALDGEAIFADCESFKVLKKFKSAKISYYELPFYTEVKDIEPIFWKIGSKKINNYDKYYRTLLKE